MGIEEKRDRKLDIIKGIAIILMVMGHSGFKYTKFIYLFHMAVFFIASGYTFRSQGKSIRNAIAYVIKKIKSIWLPTFFWSAIYILANNYFIKFGIYSDTELSILGRKMTAHTYLSIKQMIKELVKAVLMVGRTEMGGAFWFLTALFGISIIAIAVDYLLCVLIQDEKKRDIIHVAFAVVLNLTGWISSYLNLSHITIPVIFSSYLLYIIGYMMKKYGFRIKSPVFGVASFAILFVCTIYGDAINLGLNQYVNPFYMLITSLSGWMLIYSLASIVESGMLSAPLVFIGQNTLPIVIHHFWCFKIINYIQILIYKYPTNYLAGFPYLDGSSFWWIAYTVCGVFVPIILHLLVKKAKQHIIPSKSKDKMCSL